MLNDLLMWHKIGRIVILLSEKLKISPLKALDIFYTSDVCRRMHDENDNLYTFGDLFIVDELMIELAQTHE